MQLVMGIYMYVRDGQLGIDLIHGCYYSRCNFPSFTLLLDHKKNADEGCSGLEISTMHT